METKVKKSNKETNRMLPSLILGLVMVMGFGLFWWQYGQAQNLQAQLSQKQVETDLLKAENMNLKIASDSAPDILLDPNYTVDSDSQQIMSVADAYVRAPVAVEAEDFTYKISDKNGNFAKVNVAVPEGTGYMLILKKVDDQWTVLLGGQQLPGNDMAEKYGLPEGYYENY